MTTVAGAIIGRTGANGRQAIDLRAAHGSAAGTIGGIEMQAEKQIGAAALGHFGSLGQFQLRIGRARETDFEPGFGELFAEFAGQQQRVFLFLLPAFLVAGIAAAVAGVEHDGFDLTADGIFRGPEHGMDGAGQVRRRDVRGIIAHHDGRREPEVNAVERDFPGVGGDEQVAAGAGELQFAPRGDPFDLAAVRPRPVVEGDKFAAEESGALQLAQRARLRPRRQHAGPQQCEAKRGFHGQAESGGARPRIQPEFRRSRSVGARLSSAAAV